MAKAVTALTLSKDYRQDEALDWGFLTRPEQSHRLKRSQPQRAETCRRPRLDRSASNARSAMTHPSP